MRLKTPLGLWSATFFTTLGLAPLVACGGTTVGGTNQNDTDGGVHGGTGGKGTGGATEGTGGNSGFAGGTSRGGGVSDGGFTGAGGFTGSTGGNPYYGGAGGLWTGGAPGVGGAMPILSCGTQTMHLGADGKPSGFIDCQGGSIHRLGKYACATVLPRAKVCPGAVLMDGGPSYQCLTDDDCTAQPNGHCEGSSGGQAPGCYCQYGCISDSDCGAGQICLCGDPVGQCVSSTCAVDADCGNGNMCLSYTQNPGCGGTAFACQTASDTCISDADCFFNPGPGYTQGLCGLVNGAHQCAPVQCAIGRPFLVGGAARLANAVRRADWCSSLAPTVRALDRGTRDALRARWTEIALMEHASIAAFARFAMEIMSLGAPSELVRQTHAAMADETIHARDAFALASAYAGAPIGPGPLDVESALLARSPLDVVATTILEGCIGETVAAVEAAEALARATDPAVREALARVTVDETRHAELAWRFVQWVLAHDDMRFREESTTLLVGIVEAEASAAAAVAPRSRATADPALLAHGVLPEGARAELRARVLREIVAPCARALAAKSRRASTAASRAAA